MFRSTLANRWLTKFNLSLSFLILAEHLQCSIVFLLLQNSISLKNSNLSVYMLFHTLYRWPSGGIQMLWPHSWSFCFGQENCNLWHGVTLPSQTAGKLAWETVSAEKKKNLEKPVAWPSFTFTDGRHLTAAVRSTVCFLNHFYISKLM